MKKNFILMFFSVFLVVVFYSSSQAYFINGDFSAGMNGWTADGNDGAGGWKATGGNPDENFILNAAGAPGSDPTISQLVTGLTSSSWYSLTGDFASVYSSYGSPSALSFGIFADGNPLAALSRPGIEDVWGSFSYLVQAVDTDILFAFAGEMNGDDSSYRIDNILLTYVSGGQQEPGGDNPVPEPATMLLFGLGLLGLAGVNRRKK